MAVELAEDVSMNMGTRHALELINGMADADWEAVRARASRLGVGGWHWEEAWLSARAGHAAATDAYGRALSRGAGPLAAAAIAGAIAAVEAADALTADAYRRLVAPMMLATSRTSGTDQLLEASSEQLGEVIPRSVA